MPWNTGMQRSKLVMSDMMIRFFLFAFRDTAFWFMRKAKGLLVLGLSYKTH